MLEDVKYYTDLLVKFKITPNQFYLCWLLFWDHREGKGGKRVHPEKEDKVFANLYRYNELVKKWSLNEVQELLDKDLVRLARGSKIIVDRLEITEKFMKAVLITQGMQDEFFEAYPTWIQNFDHPSKPNINLKSCDHDKVKDLYRYHVKTKKRHKEVMDILDWAKRNDKIRYSIANFVKAKMWEQFEELMEKEGASIQDGKFGTKTAF